MPTERIGTGQLPEAIDLLVIGGGAAGLAVSRELSRMGIEHFVLEQGRIGESWRSMPPALQLVSPWWTNALSMRDVFRHWPFSRVSATDYARYLNAFALRHSPPVVEGCSVFELAPVPGAHGGFLVATNRGSIRARAVVCASGYFFQPAQPDPCPPSDATVPTVHASLYPGPEGVRALAVGRPVVVVGRRISAGQLMVELSDHGIEVVLSTKSKVEFRRDGFVGAVKDFLYYFYEECLLALRPRLKAPSFPVMDGGRSRRLIESGRVQTIPPIASISNGALELSDGSLIEAGLVINATGYRPVLRYLPDAFQVALAEDGLPECKDWESTSLPGLFFIGLDNRPSYRSRTLRGIRWECRGLARQVVLRLSDLRTATQAA